MNEQVSGVIQVSSQHLNLLLILGLALLGGVISGRIFKKMQIPQVVASIALGVVLGTSGLKIIDRAMLDSFTPFNYFALGMIGFMIGGKLKKEVFLKHNKQLLTILFFETLTPFLLVTVLFGTIGSYLLGNHMAGWTLGVLIGAISVATAPVTTMEVIRECRAKGPLTRTIINLVALANISALILFDISVSLGGKFLGNSDIPSGLRIIWGPAREIIIAVILGVIVGLFLNRLFRRFREAEIRLVTSLGAILLTTGLAVSLGIDMLVSLIVLGCVVSNTTGDRNREIFNLLEGFTPPIFILFFILVGAKLDISYLDRSAAILIALYLAGAGLGKVSGCRLGARLSSAAAPVRRYLPFSLFSQAGLASGLAILAADYFPGEIGDTLIAVVASGIIVLEIGGPLFLRNGLEKSGEAGLNITVEDYSRHARVAEIMRPGTTRLKPGTSLEEILRIVGETSDLYYPVINENGVPAGVVSFETVRKILNESEASGLILAADIMEPVRKTISGETLLSEAIRVFDHFHLDYLPVVGPGGTLSGFLERNRFERNIEARVLEIQKKGDEPD